MACAIRQMLAVRHRLKASTVSSFLKHALPTSSEALSRLLSFVAKVWMATQCAWCAKRERSLHIAQIFIWLIASLQVEMGEASMEVDTPSPPSSTSQSQPSYKQSVLPELESFSYLLVIIFLIDHKHLEDVCLFTCTFWADAFLLLVHIETRVVRSFCLQWSTQLWDHGATSVEKSNHKFQPCLKLLCSHTWFGTMRIEYCMKTVFYWYGVIGETLLISCNQKIAAVQSTDAWCFGSTTLLLLLLEPWAHWLSCWY